MFCKIVILVLIALIYVQGATANPQVTTALPFEVDHDPSRQGSSGDDDILSGVIAGTGSDGTTYVLSVGATDSQDVPYTVTLVENASGGTAVLRIPEEGYIAIESIACGFSDGNAACTEAVIAISGTATITEFQTTTGVADSLTVVVSTSLASTSSTGIASASGSTQSSGARVNAVSGLFASIVYCLSAAAVFA